MSIIGSVQFRSQSAGAVGICIGRAGRVSCCQVAAAERCVGLRTQAAAAAAAAPWAGSIASQMTATRPGVGSSTGGRGGSASHADPQSSKMRGPTRRPQLHTLNHSRRSAARLVPRRARAVAGAGAACNRSLASTHVHSTRASNPTTAGGPHWNEREGSKIADQSDILRRARVCRRRPAMRSAAAAANCA